jgi:sigma-B regulation protein RsbU (phosphoserine phosphatase)
MSKEKILLVDDNPTNLQVLFQALDGSGYNLLVAKSGEAALDIVGKAHPDLILLDIMMPGIDGYEVCRRLKKDESSSDIPVIFLSSLQDTADKVLGFQVGAVDYVNKPFQSDEVKARVNTHLTIHHLRRAVENQKEKLENELEVVSEVQRRLLPKTLPGIKGIQLAVHYETSRYAGGDYYDIVELPDNRWGFLMADAEGHSAPAAVLMAMTCALFRAYGGPAHEPGKMIDYLNTHLCKVADPSFITAIYAVYDANRQCLRIARAGHPHPMIYRAADAKAVWHECDGVAPLGILPYDRVPETVIQLEREDRLLLYTDGVTERFSQDGEIYGEQRLIELLTNSIHRLPQDNLKAIVDDLERFAAGRPADDDQALLLGHID